MRRPSCNFALDLSPVEGYTIIPMDTQWLLDDYEGDDGFRHIWPVEDAREHQLEGVECWCSPAVDLECGLVIHNRVE